MSVTARYILLSGSEIGLRVAIGWALLYAGYSKMRAPFGFLENVYAYEVAGPKSSAFVAALLPPLEVAVGFFLIAGAVRVGAWTVAMLLGTLFVFAQFVAFQRGLNIPCGCLGSISSQPETIGYFTVFRALIIAALCVLGLTISLILPKYEGSPSVRANTAKVTQRTPIPGGV